MTTYNINGLKQFMVQLLGSNIVINNNRHPNKNDDLIINRDILLDHFTDNKIHDYAKKEKWTNDIPLQKFIDFLVNHAGSKQGSRSKYHEYMEFHPSLFNLDIDRGIPNYSKILMIDLKNKIIPSREEYLPCFWIVHKIRNHNFLNNYLDLVLPKFQKLLSFDDARFYDIVFDKLGIVIEVQEDAEHHDQSENDLLKESLALCRDNYIMYFKMSMYKKYHNQYLAEFWNKLYDHILASLFMYEKINNNEEVIRKNYVIHRFRELCLNEMTQLENEKSGYLTKDIKYKSITNRINMLKKITITDDNNATIEKVFNWKKKSIEEKKQYCIKLDNILNMLNEDIDDEKTINNYKLNYLYFEQNNDDNIYVDWETMILMICRSNNIEPDQIANIMYYLVNVEKIYTEICNIIIIDANERKKSCNIELVENHIKLKSELKYQRDIEKYKIENDTLLAENKIHQKNINNLVKSIDDHTKLKKIISQFNGKNIDFVTINLSDHNKSIFVELPNFPIRYSCYQDHHITYEEFHSYCDVVSIKQTYRNEFINQLFGCKNNCHGILSHLIITSDAFDKKNNNSQLYYIDNLTVDFMMNQFEEKIKLKYIKNISLDEQTINIDVDTSSDEDSIVISNKKHTRGKKSIDYFDM